MTMRSLRIVALHMICMLMACCTMRMQNQYYPFQSLSHAWDCESRTYPDRPYYLEPGYQMDAAKQQSAKQLMGLIKESDNSYFQQLGKELRAALTQPSSELMRLARARCVARREYCEFLRPLPKLNATKGCGACWDPEMRISEFENFKYFGLLNKKEKEIIMGQISCITTRTTTGKQ